MKTYKLKSLILLIVVIFAVALTGCLGGSISKKETETEVKAQLNELTDDFVTSFKNQDTKKLMLLFAEPMDFVVDLGEEVLEQYEQQKAGTVEMFDRLLEDEEFRAWFVEDAPGLFLDYLSELITVYEKHNQDIENQELRDLIDETVDILIKITLIGDILQSDLDDPSPVIIEWALASEFLAPELKMPRGAFEDFITEVTSGLEGIRMDVVTSLYEEKGKWYVVLEAALLEVNDEPIDLLVGFGKQGSKWLIDYFRLGPLTNE